MGPEGVKVMYIDRKRRHLASMETESEPPEEKVKCSYPCACGVPGQGNARLCFDAYYKGKADVADGRKWCLCSCHRAKGAKPE